MSPSGATMLRADTTQIPAEVLLYLDTIEAAGRTPATVRQYRHVLAAFGRPMHAIALDVRDFLDRYPNHNTRAVYLINLRQFYQFCIRRGLLSTDPTAGIPVPKTHRRRWPLISEGEFVRLRDHAAPWLRVLVTVLYRVGSRITETCTIRTEHVYLDGDRGTIDFPRRKGGEAGFAAFGAEVSAELSTWLPGCGEWVFPHLQDPTRHILPARARYAIGRLGRAAGIPGSLAPHRFRHTFVTQAVDGGWPQLALQQQLGHANALSTAQYYRPSRKGLMEVYGRAEKHQ